MESVKNKKIKFTAVGSVPCRLILKCHVVRSKVAYNGNCRAGFDDLAL